MGFQPQQSYCSGAESECERDGGSELECYTSSGEYILAARGFSTVNTYQNIVVSNCALLKINYKFSQ